MTPLTRLLPLCYMAEWRSGFDRGLRYAYQTVYFSDATNEWEVDHAACTVPGMLLWLRNGAYELDYTLEDSVADGPSVGPKHALLVVDSHPEPFSWRTQAYESGAKVRIAATCQSVDGADFAGSALGSGDPRDDGVQYGVNIAVLGKAGDGSWGRIAVWNATTLVRLRVTGPAHVAPGRLLTYRLSARNLGPAPQSFVVPDQIPEHTTYVCGGRFEAGSRSVAWSGKLRAGETRSLFVTVRVDAAAPAGTVIANDAVLGDDASGSSESARTLVTERRR